MIDVANSPHRHDGEGSGDPAVDGHSHDEHGHHPHEHSHAHEHSHEHPHEHGADQAHDPHIAGDGPTVLEIGGEIGALILLTPAELAGAEIEISPTDDPGRRHHVAVHPRQLPGGSTIYAAMYYSLQAGSYQLWAADGSVALTVEIDGGKIAECHWPDGVAAPR